MAAFYIYLLVFSRVRSLTIVLDDVKLVLPYRNLTPQQRKDLVEIFTGCYNILNKLQKALQNYPELDLNPQVHEIKGTHNLIQRAYKRIKWEPQEIEELRKRIVSNISLLTAFNGQLIRYDGFLLLNFLQS